MKSQAPFRRFQNRGPTTVLADHSDRRNGAPVWRCGSRRAQRFCLGGVLALWLLNAFAAQAQPRPYIGFVYPAGGQQGSTFQIRLGGQNLDEVTGVLVTGAGVQARLTENFRRLNNQEMQLLNEQLRTLRRETMSKAAQTNMMSAEPAAMMSTSATNTAEKIEGQNPEELSLEAKRTLINRIEKRTFEYVPNPACASIASLSLVEVTISPDADPGAREIRLVTLRGVSNPLAFHVGQLPEHTRKPMITAIQQVLGKESSSLRKRPSSEVENAVTIPCTLNGQIASGEVNRYRFSARAGQRLVIATLARSLVPFIADAVPGWFQPVLVLYESQGKEVAYDDDFRFKPDPTILCQVPKDGEYVLEIHDSLYRGREDFVYRITLGELPFITSLFPLGGKAGALPRPALQGCNLEGAELDRLPPDAKPGLFSLAATRNKLVSNHVPFVVDDLPDINEREPNDTPAAAQQISLPVVINGRIGKPDDWDVFQFSGKSNDTVVAEVLARRLDSPLDSLIKLTDAAGQVVGFNDDHEDLAAGLNTHHADSYFMARLPADGTYFVHIGDTARQGGPEYGYRLRVSAPQPDFELRVVPSSLSMRSKSTATLNVYAKRKDGFTGLIKIALQDPPAGFTASPVTFSATQCIGRITVKTTLLSTPDPMNLSVIGTAKIGNEELTREAVPAEDKMQAFLWRQLVPAQELRALVFDPNYQPPVRRIEPTNTIALMMQVLKSNAVAEAAAATLTNSVALTNAAGLTNAVARTNSIVGTNALASTNIVARTNAVAQRPKFTKQQVAFRLRQLKFLYEADLLTEQFYSEKVAECETDE